MNTNSGDDQPSAGREARYANYFEVGANQEEIVIDLGQAYGEHASVSIHTRIVTNPVSARELARLLERALEGADDGETDD